MSSTFAGINTMARGLYGQQAALDTVGHNVANASTAGYSRQTVNLSATTPETIYTGNGSAQKGTGVEVTSIVRARDALVDKQMWKESSTLNYAEATQSTMSKIETTFAEPTDTGMQSVLNKFWDSLQTLATNASDASTRTEVRERGVELANNITQSAQQLKDMVTDINANIVSKVTSINETSSEIASLNTQIRNIEVGGLDHANDLRDKRDLLVDTLSADVDTRVTEQKDGTYTIQSGNVILVNGDNFQKLSTDPLPGAATTDDDYGYELKNVSSAGTAATFSSGSLKGLLDMRDSTSTQKGIKSYLDDLSKMSQFLQSDFNAVNRSGYGSDNTTNNNFFGDNTGNTLNQISTQNISTNFSTAITFAAGDKLTIGDAAVDATTGKPGGNTMSIDLSTIVPANTTPIDASNLSTYMANLATAINTNAPTQVPPVNVRASYDSTTGKFLLSTTGSSTQLSISATDAAPATPNATNFLNNLDLAAPKKSYWLDNMVVNPALFDSTTGLAKIDAKTAANASGIVVTNTAVPAVTGQGTAVAFATGTYTGTGTTAVVAKIVNAAGDIQYSTDSGVTWSANIASNNSTPPQYALPIAGANVTLQITSGNLNDQYAFSLSSSNITSLKVTQSNASGGNATIASATGIYTQSTTATSVKANITGVTATGTVTGISYCTSTDGGKTWSSATSSALNYYQVTIGSVTSGQVSGATYKTSTDGVTWSAAIAFTGSNIDTVTDSNNTALKLPDGSVFKIATGAANSASNVYKIGIDKTVTETTGSGGVTTVTPSASPYSLVINGVTVNMNIGTNLKNAVGDQYNFTLSEGNSASGDNAVLLSKRMKTDTAATLGGQSLDTYYSSLIGALGVQSQDAQRLTTNQQTLVDQITSWRESTSGINMDQEMTNMITYQKGYSAAAKMLTTMDQMLETLLSSVGR